MKPALHVDSEKSAAAYFSSPYTDAESGVSPPQVPLPLPAGPPSPSMAMSMLGDPSGARWPPRQGVLARARSRLAGRNLRRLIWLAVFVTTALYLFTRDRSVWFPNQEPPATQGTEHISEHTATPTPETVPDATQSFPELVSEPVKVPEPEPEREPGPEPEPIEMGPAGLPFDASLEGVRSQDPSIPRPKEFSPFYGGSSRREIDIASDPLPLSATLKERLAVWRNAPGGRGEVPGEVELGGFMQYNLEECGTIEHSHNTHMIQVGAIVWQSFNRSSLHRERERLITYLEGLDGTPALENKGKGRGIVMQAGNSDTLKRAAWSIEFMRSRGSKLPVQIYCFPEELPAADDPIYETLRGLNAELVAAKGQSKDEGKTKSYHLKAIAMIENPFREVLYLDSDSIPARDPEYMFDAPSYKRLGIFATPDYWKTTAGNPIWAIMGVKCRGEWEMETGQMFIDKEHHLDVLWLVRFMLENHGDTEGWPGYFRYSDGDKDLFRWAMLMLRKRWGVPGRWVAGGALPTDTPTGFCSHTMMQHDAWGEPLFVHYNLLKQIPSGVGRNYCWGRTKQMPLFNTFPASPAIARLGEPVLRPNDVEARGLGDIDCDMLADADEFGVARAPAKEMIMRRAARERGVKVKYHGGSVSALCIDFDYIDPRPQKRKDSEKSYRDAQQDRHRKMLEQWEADVEDARNRQQLVPSRPKLEDAVILPDWSPPYEVVQWSQDKTLEAFQGDLFNLGFIPNGKGF